MKINGDKIVTSRPSFFLPVIVTFAPSFANKAAVSAPMPDDEP